MMRQMRSKIYNTTLKAFSTALDKYTYSEVKTGKPYFDPSLSTPDCKKYKKVSDNDVAKGKEFIEDIMEEKLLVITGSGISTESGYMDMKKLEEQEYKPMKLEDEKDLKRLWAQYYAIWHEICKVKPNRAHVKLHTLEKQNKLQWIFTKNVDNLHSKEGSKRVTELYGSIREVRCQTKQCDHKVLREHFQEQMQRENASVEKVLSGITKVDRFRGFPPNATMTFNNEIEKAIDEFKVPLYSPCNGNPMPNFRYYAADACAKQTLENELLKSEKILVLGTSLSKDSYIQNILIDAYTNKGKQILVVNIDETPISALQKKDKDKKLKLRKENNHILLVDSKSERLNGKEIRFIKANCGEFLEKVVT